MKAADFLRNIILERNIPGVRLLRRPVQGRIETKLPAEAPLDMGGHIRQGHDAVLADICRKAEIHPESVWRDFPEFDLAGETIDPGYAHELRQSDALRIADLNSDPVARLPQPVEIV